MLKLTAIREMFVNISMQLDQASVRARSVNGFHNGWDKIMGYIDVL